MLTTPTIEGRPAGTSGEARYVLTGRASSHSENLIVWAAAVLDNTAAQIIG